MTIDRRDLALSVGYHQERSTLRVGSPGLDDHPDFFSKRFIRSADQKPATIQDLTGENAALQVHALGWKVGMEKIEVKVSLIPSRAITDAILRDGLEVLNGVSYFDLTELYEAD